MGNNRPNNRPGNNPQNGKGKLKRYKGKNVDPTSGPAQLGNHATRLFKNMAFGEFNYERDSPLFSNKEFLNAALHEVEIKILEEQYYVNSLNYAYGGVSADGIVTRLLNRHMRALDGWKMVYTTLGAIMNTGDFGLLIGMMNRLPDYKHVL